VIRNIKRYSILIGLILKHGQWRHSGEDFNQSRRENLVELQSFVPSTVSQNRGSTSVLFRNAFTRNLISQFSFLKNSIQRRGGHLTTGDLCYIRIPKSGSTSINKVILEKKYPTLKQKEISNKQINFLTDVNLHTHATKSDNHTYFTIVRNPLRRLVSVYRGFFENNSANYIYRDYLFGILPQHLSFSNFVERLASIPDHLKDQHIKPQHCFLEYYEQKKIDVTIFRLEDSEKVNQFLNQNSLELLYLNKSEKPYDYRSYFTRKTLAIASEIYQKDIDRFGYQHEVNALTEYINSVQ
jgi:hypothetical protein